MQSAGSSQRKALRKIFASMRKKLTNKGFTVFEMLTVFAILAIIASSIALMMRQMTGGYQRIMSKQSLSDTSRTIIQYMTRDLENAFVVRDGLSSYQFQGTAETVDFNAFLETDDGYSEMVEVGYSLVGNELMRRVQTADVPDNNVKSGGTVSKIAGNVTELSFGYAYKQATLTVTNPDGLNTWDSSVNGRTNYDFVGEKDPDGLPDVVKVSFTVRDEHDPSITQDYSVNVYLPHDK